MAQERQCLGYMSRVYFFLIEVMTILGTQNIKFEPRGTQIESVIYTVIIKICSESGTLGSLLYHITLEAMS